LGRECASHLVGGARRKESFVRRSGNWPATKGLSPIICILQWIVAIPCGRSELGFLDVRTRDHCGEQPERAVRAIPAIGDGFNAHGTFGSMMVNRSCRTTSSMQ
jgi:hypothetical protein